jgi:hypothetical protein
MRTDESAWFSSEDIALLEGSSERWARRKYTRLAQQMDPAERVWMRYSQAEGARGMGRAEFPFELLEPATKAKLFNSDSRIQISASGVSEGPDLPAQPSYINPESETASAGPSGKQFSAIGRQLSKRALTLVPAVLAGSIIDLGTAAQQLLPLDSVRLGKALVRMPESKRAWARARMRALEPLIASRAGDAPWELWRGQTVHDVAIRTKLDFVQALARDSDCENALLANWKSINAELQSALSDPCASITPLSERSIRRLLAYYEYGRPLSTCPAAGCRGEVDQKTGICNGCGQERRLPAGLEALQDLDRSDRGNIHLQPKHAEWLTALYLGGDGAVRHSKLALERPRSAAECLEILQLEINAGELAGPAPSYHQIRRWVNEALPRIVRDYAREGRQRALARRGPYIPRRYAESTEVNDCWICDFRRLDVRGWIDADERLYRVYLCGIMDASSRDVTFLFDLYPSGQLFKSTLRLALLKWGKPRDIWLDNGHEFTCEDVMGGTTTRTWTERVECDQEALSIFDNLDVDPHFAIKYNPNGKAELERFFHRFHDFELNLPGFTDSDTKKRPERLKHEELEHTEFCRGLRPQTPLLRIDQLVDFETRFIEANYRHHPHSGYGMHRRTPAQVQAAFPGVREIPNAAELDILLWYRKTLRARGDKVSVQYNKTTFIFRADELLALPGDCETEVHLDPLNADRALARIGDRWIELEPVNPTGERTPKEVASEMERRRHLEKQIGKAALLGSSLAPVPSPERYLELLEAQAARKQQSLDAQRRDTRRQVEIPQYAEAAALAEESADGQVGRSADGQQSAGGQMGRSADGDEWEPATRWGDPPTVCHSERSEESRTALDHPELGSVPYTMEKLDRQERRQAAAHGRAQQPNEERVFTSRTEFERWQQSRK